MNRNRKHQTAAMRFGPALKALSLCAFLGGSGVGYVWQKDQINTLGEQLRRAERRLEDLRGRNERLGRILATMQSPAEIEARIRRSDLGMIAPQPDQIVRLVELPAAAERTAASDQRLYAGDATHLWVAR
ncbi:MAG: hypothetical protein U1G07_03290 [Verrucomicrobiota bacterium]